MNDQDEDFKGKKIPKEYWNKLVEWKVDSPYDGCWFKYSQACVDMDGNFRLINSEGRDINDWMEVYKSPHGLCIGYKGLYDHSDGWSEREKKRIREKHGFLSVEDPSVQLNQLLYAAIEKVFGKKWYDVEYKERMESKEVAALIAEPKARLDAYERDMKGYRRRRQERLNALFCGALYDKTPDEWKLYPIDEKHIKHTCEDFCRNYGSTVAVMCGVLDRLQDIGYSCWCKCSDCGKMFQLQDMEKFSFLIDDNAYHGDNGIGCIYTRVMCESCRDNSQCPQCSELNLPNPDDPSVQGHEYDHTSYRERFIMKWMGVCEYCADSFFYEDEYKHWDEDMDALESTVDKGMAQLKKYLEIMKEQRKTEEELKRLEEDNLASLSVTWRELTNELREKMEKDVYEFFSDANDWAKNRIGDKEKYDYR